MKLRVDLLEHLTTEDVIEEALANQHRYKAEPTFSKTGTGYLSPRSTQDSVKEAERSRALTTKLTTRLQESGNKNVKTP
ncbi:MAG: hypothetical protein HC904_10470 [Blastochloris sp.]|nr:hypothetical protein [Blastochloris sp.]